MALERADRVKDTTTDTGTGTIDLDESAPTGYQDFADAITDGAEVEYLIISSDESEWETGKGTFTAGTPDTLSRDTVYDSSTGSKVSFSAGTKDVMLVVTAATIDDIYDEIANKKFHLSTIFEDPTSSRFDWDNSNSGSRSADEGGMQIQTGSIAGSHARIRLSQNPSTFATFDNNPTFHCLLANTSRKISSTFFGLGAVNVSGTGHTYTGYQMGFKALKTTAPDDGDIYATNGNGTSETATDTTENFGNSSYRELYLEAVADTSIKFYVDGTLKATHTTNIPSKTQTGIGSCAQISVANDSNADNATFKVLNVDCAWDAKH